MPKKKIPPGYLLIPDLDDYRACKAEFDRQYQARHPGRVPVKKGGPTRRLSEQQIDDAFLKLWRGYTPSQRARGWLSLEDDFRAMLEKDHGVTYSLRTVRGFIQRCQGLVPYLEIKQALLDQRQLRKVRAIAYATVELRGERHDMGWTFMRPDRPSKL